MSDRASLPEVCGQAALYCNPDDPADIAAKLRRVLTSQSAPGRAACGRPRSRAREFSWGRAAAQLEELARRGPPAGGRMSLPSSFRVVHAAENIKGGVGTYLRDLVVAQRASFGDGSVVVQSYPAPKATSSNPPQASK